MLGRGLKSTSTHIKRKIVLDSIVSVILVLLTHSYESVWEGCVLI